MKEKVENFIQMIRKIKMTEEEKESVRLKVAATVKMKSPAAPAKTPSPYFSRFSFRMIGKVTALGLLFVMVGIGGLSYASANALPGDILYPVKLAKEKIEQYLVSTPEEKVALEQATINTRFSEVETLIKEKKITPENRSIAEAKIQETTNEISSDLDQINKGDPQAAADAKTTLDASIAENQEKIDDLIEQTDVSVTSTDPTLDGGEAPGETDFDGEDDSDIGGAPAAITSTDPTLDGGSGPDTTAPSLNGDSSTDTQSSLDGSISQDIKVTAGSGVTTSTTAPTDTGHHSGASPDQN